MQPLIRTGERRRLVFDDHMAPPLWSSGLRSHERHWPRGRRGIWWGAGEGARADRRTEEETGHRRTKEKTRHGRTEEKTGYGHEDRQQRKAGSGQIGERREGKGSGRERERRKGK